MNRIHYTHCPVCGSADLQNMLQAKDHTVSGELFWIAECTNCTVRLTQDVPDESSIGSYYKSENYISHTNTAKGLINRLYHFIRKRTLLRKRNLIREITGLLHGKLLDLGSGTGSFLREMQQAGWEADGLEPDAVARKRAKELNGVDLSDTDRFYHLLPGSFDAITLWHVLEHVHELNLYVQQLKKIVKDTGKIFIAVPNHASADAQIYKEHWAAYDVPRHLYHFSPRSMQVLMEKNGLKIVGYKPMWYDSFYISMLSSKYKNGRTNLAAACWNGLRSNLKTSGDVKKCSSIIYIVGKE
jgi:2-polyprenyl-3-methyl-5-hydroxy-6-metoxy-1,4-benzoquinol methylase